MFESLARASSNKTARPLSHSIAPVSLVHPTEDDVILGRGNLHANHPGNARFYEILDNCIPSYNAARSRSEKSRVIQTVFELVTSQGRFVKQHPCSAACVVITVDAAKKKISHAIRFRRRRAEQALPVARRRKRVDSPRSRSLSQRVEEASQQAAAVQGARATQLQPFLRREQQSSQEPQNTTTTFALIRHDQIRENNSPGCIFSDGELESVLLSPEEMKDVSILLDQVFLSKYP